MGERKVLNKYFPPDFDPKKVPRMKRDPEKQIGVRMMIPFSMQCNTCGEFMYRGKKFNSLKEDCIGEDYLGIRRFRFYIKCVICSQEITFKTDPEKGDYELETGASRNFESWTDKQATEEKHKKAREEEEKSDNMKQLENRTLDSKIELEIMDALDEIKAVNRRHETVDTAEVLKRSAARRENGTADPAAQKNGYPDEDEALIAKIQFGGSRVRRLAEADDIDYHSDPDGLESRSTEEPEKSSASKGKQPQSKSRGTGFSAVEDAPRFQSVRNNGGGAVVAVTTDDARGGENGNEKARGGVDEVPDVPRSLLVAGLEAQAKREANKVKAAAAESASTKILVKPKKKRLKTGAGGGGAGQDVSTSKKRKKHKGKHKNDVADKAESGNVKEGVPAPAVAVGAAEDAAGAAALGGLNLLGSYDSSGSDDGPDGGR